MGMRVALTGRMRSGKDEAARHLVIRHGFQRLAFGDGIREVCRLVFPEFMASSSKPRALLQGVGQDLRRYDQDVWVKHVLRQLQALSPDANVVVTDLRQPNEWQALKGAGFKIIRISASEFNRRRRCRKSGDDFGDREFCHETEASVDRLSVDYEVFNDGPLDSLHEQLDEMVVTLRWAR